MTARRPACAVTRHLSDGTAVTDWWRLDDDTAAAVHTLLGDPDIRVDGTMYDTPPPTLRGRRRDWLRGLRARTGR